MFSETPIVRRKSRQIMVGNVPVGGDAPISVQSMTNTSTADVAATVEQIKRIQLAGADIVRVSVPSLEEAEAFVEDRFDLHGNDNHFNFWRADQLGDSKKNCALVENPVPKSAWDAGYGRKVVLQVSNSGLHY